MKPIFEKTGIRETSTKHYGIDTKKIKKLIKIQEESTKVIYKVYTTKEKYALHITPQKEKYIHTQNMLAKTIKKELSIPTTIYIKPKSIELKGLHKGKDQKYYVYVKNWLPGNKYRGKPEEIRNAAETLYRIHRLTSNLEAPREIIAKRKLRESFSQNSIIKYTQILEKSIKNKIWDKSELEWIISKKNQLIKEWEKIVLFYQKDKSNIDTLLQGDYTPNNILFGDQSNVVGILDFSSIKYDDYYREVAWSSITFAQNQGSSHKVSEKLYNLFLEEYSKNSINLNKERVDTIALARCLKIQKNQMRKYLANNWYNKRYIQKTMALIDFLIKSKDKNSEVKVT